VRGFMKRLIVLEVLLVVLFVSRMLLGALGPKLNAERVKRSAEKLERIPEEIAGWKWDSTVKSTGAHIDQVTGGGWNLFVRSYVRPEAGDTLYFQVCRWLDPLSCYEMHGWEVVQARTPFLGGKQGRVLRASGVRECWIEKGEERMGVLFWESDLLDPDIIRGDALTEDTGVKGRLSKLWGRTQRRLKSFFQKSDVVVKVIYVGEGESEETGEAVLRFTREIQQLLPDVLK